MGCDEIRELNGGEFPGDPDPCAYSCVFQSFGSEALSWYDMFRKGAKGSVQKENGPVTWELDYPAVEFLFEANGVTNRKEGLEVLYEVISLYDNPDLTDEEILFGEDEDD